MRARKLKPHMFHGDWNCTLEPRKDGVRVASGQPRFVNSIVYLSLTLARCRVRVNTRHSHPILHNALSVGQKHICFHDRGVDANSATVGDPVTLRDHDDLPIQLLNDVRPEERLVPSPPWTFPTTLTSLPIFTGAARTTSAFCQARQERRHKQPSGNWAECPYSRSLNSCFARVCSRRSSRYQSASRTER